MKRSLPESQRDPGLRNAKIGGTQPVYENFVRRVTQESALELPTTQSQGFRNSGRSKLEPHPLLVRQTERFCSVSVYLVPVYATGAYRQVQFCSMSAVTGCLISVR